jgi:hypothetical protein
MLTLPPCALAAAAQVLPDRADEPPAGRFAHTWWFEKGMEYGNPVPTGRFRVNSPEVTLHPAQGLRQEAKSSGMMQILVDENLQRCEGAELYLELWGGHPGTMQKRVTPNGRTTYWIPEVGSAASKCTHQYPTVRLKITDLVPGYNAFQFACDQGPSFWGHYIVDQACVRTFLPGSHPDVKKAGLDTFSAAAQVRGGDEMLDLSIKVPQDRRPRIARVNYYGFYEGYAENGGTAAKQWHGFTTARNPVAIVGSAIKEPFTARWDVSMLPAQKGMAVRAVVQFAEPANLIYETAAIGLEVGAGRQRTVQLFSASEKATPFWSRAGRLKTAVIKLDIDSAGIEKAELHTVVWDGGKGKVAEYFKLNGRFFDIAGAGKHDVRYTVHAVPPDVLRKGANEIELVSDTQGHGIEMLEPGPALMVRYRR